MHFVTAVRNRNNSEKPEKSGNERNRKGTNFVPVGCIRKSWKKIRKKKWKDPEKSGNERIRKGNKFMTAACT